jgi:hypothetical protein
MFLFVGNEYINLDAIARVGFTTTAQGYTATIHFSKSGGADRHFCYGDEAKKLEETLKDLEYLLPKNRKGKKVVQTNQRAYAGK